MIYVEHAFFTDVRDLMKKMFPEKSVKPVSNLSVVPSDMELLIFTGGADISPTFYGEDNYYSFTSPSRDVMELDLLELVTPKEIPLFGICRGHQLITAYFGGKLYQDLDVVNLSHSGQHSVLYGEEELFVNSMHHQGSKVDAPGQKVLGTHKGIAELTVGEVYPYVTTQFHPEFSHTQRVFDILLGLIGEL